MLPEIHALWIGPHLPARAAGCLRSFARLGHKVVLHTYAELAGVPAGVETADANLVLTADKIFRHTGNGQVAIFADWFRYKLLSRHRCLWVDCDVYAVRPIDFDTDTIFGREDDEVINIAVLMLPPESPVLAGLLALFEGKPRRPGSLSTSTWLRTRIKAMLYGVPWVATAPWGITGPYELARLLKVRGLAAQAQPPGVFYPVPWSRLDLLERAGVDIAAHIGPETRAIHLWNEMTRGRGNPEPGSLLARVDAEGLGGPPALLV
jgi:hypothetical protein